MPEAKKPWYPDGLRFECTGCHACCRGEHPGVVYLTEREAAGIALFLGVSERQFRASHLSSEGGQRTIRLDRNGDCSLWKGGCTVYPKRPRQCRTYPFWPEFLKNRAAWEKEACACEGMNRGELHPLVEIRGVLRSRR